MKIPNGRSPDRDQNHTLLGIGLMANLCEMAWSQGDDLYGWADNRFMEATEYVAPFPATRHHSLV